MNHSAPIFFAQAQQPAAPAPSGSPSGAAPQNPMMGMLVPMLLIFGIMYFMMIRPESRKRKEHQKLVDTLKPGDKVITSGGIHGVIANVKDKIVLVKIADNVKVEMQRSSIQTVLTKSESATETPAVKADKP